MASRIAGIVVEIGGDTTKLTKALNGVNKSISQTQSTLRDVNKLLKLDPGNAELLQQKQKNLANAISETKNKLTALKNASEEAAKTKDNYDAWKAVYDPIQTKIKETSDRLSKLKESAQKAEQQLAEGKIPQDRYDALQAEIKNTERDLKELKEEAKAVTDEFGNPIPPEQYDAIQREIIETEQNLKSLEEEYKNFGSVANQQIKAAGGKMQEVGGKISAVGDTMKDIGGSITKNVSVPIAAAAGASVAAWTEVDEAMDTIVTKTGASGDALADMQDRAKNIAETIPTSFQTAADAVGEVNTRFGLTGDALEELSSQFVQFAELNDTDVSSSVDLVQSALTAFGLSADDAGMMLDVLNKAGQDTGVSVDTLAGLLTTNAASLKEMGFNASDSAMFLANLSKNGMDSSAVMTGLKKAYAESVKEGKPMGEMLSDLQTRLQDSNTHAEAAAEAIELFGSKAGGQLVDALTNGRLSFEDLGTSMTDFSGNVSSTFDETLDPLDRMQSTMNTLKSIGADIVETTAPMLEQAMTGLSDIVHKVSDAWNGLSENQQQMILKIAGVVAAIGPVISIIGTVVGGIGSVISVAGSLMSSLGALISPIGLVVAAIAGAVAIGVALYKNWDEISAWASEKWTAIKDTVSGAWDGIKEKVSNAAKTVGDTISGAWDNVKTWTSDKWDAAKKTVSDAWESIKSKTSSVAETVKSKVSGAWNDIKTGTSEKWNSIRTTVSDKAGKITSTISDKFNDAKNKADSIFNNIKNAISGKIGDARDAVHDAIERIKGFFNFSWSLPHISLPHFSISGGFSLNPPSIPHISVSWYKKAMDKAMVLDGATVFGQMGSHMLAGGEAGREVISGEDHLVGMIGGIVDNAISQRMSGVSDILERYLPYLAAGQNLYLDKRELAGRLAPDMNLALGQIKTRGERL